MHVRLEIKNYSIFSSFRFVRPYLLRNFDEIVLYLVEELGHFSFVFFVFHFLQQFNI